MSTLIIDQRGTILQHDSGAIVIRIKDERPKTIPMNLLDRVIVAGAVQIDSTLLTQLAEHDISMIAMPGRGARRSAFLYGMSHGDAARRLEQYRLVNDDHAKLTWARRLVRMKITGQIRLLQKALLARKDCRYQLMSGVDDLKAALVNAKSTVRVESLRGIEGAASARFFRAYRSLFASSLDFNERNRRPPRDPVNAALSLGYTLAHSDAITALTRAGLDPMLGFLHEPAYSRESLACDLVEMARPRIEYLIWRLFAQQDLTASQFSTDAGACRINKAARGIYFGSYEQHATCHRRWFRRYANALASACSSAMPKIQKDGDYK